MASTDGFLTERQRQLLRSVSLDRGSGAEPGSPKTKRSVSMGRDSVAEATSPRPLSDLHTKHGAAGGGGGDNKSGVIAKHDRRSHSGRSGRPKKGGAGGKGTWGALLENDGELHTDRSDPNYDSEKEPYKLVGAPIAQSLEEYKEKVVGIVEEYFTTDNVAETAADLCELGSSNYHHYFVKKLISMSLDRHDREKEMASVLLSALYADVIQPEQLAKGFTRLVESVDDLALDIPDAVDILALFVARAVVDDILPPAFLKKTMQTLPEGCKGHDVIQKAEKSYLSAPLHAEIVERRWGGSTHSTVEEVKRKINALLNEYVESGDKAEACRCIRELNVSFFHHEVVKKALTLAMEKTSAEPLILSLLKETAEEGLITSSQMSKGFARLSDAVDDLSLDILNAKKMLHSLISKATREGWLSAASTTTLSFPVDDETPDYPDSNEVKVFKQKATSVIQEYFLSDDVREVIRSLKDLAAFDFNPFFVKKLITLAMDRKNREKEMASVLLSALYAEVIPTEAVAQGFILLLESSEDMALDIPSTADELALFLSRAVIDDILAPLDLEEIKGHLTPGSLGSEIAHSARALLSARHAGERILRCWGGGTGWAVEDAKDKIIKLLEEYEAGGDVSEACHCIRDIDMPFFHHEVVKKALIMAMEKQNDRLLSLLQECSSEGLITTNQMSKGFTRVSDSLDDLALDIPIAKAKFATYVEQAKREGWLKTTFSFNPKADAPEAYGSADVGN